MLYTSAIVPCADYGDCETALNAAIDAIDGLSFVRPGMCVGIKANLVAPMKPEAGATTHPALVAALTKRLVSLGAKVIVGDSPGGLFTPAALHAVYHATGMAAAEAEGAELNLDCSSKTVNIDGLKMHSLTYTTWLDRCDAVIDFCKLKSHGMMGMSGAVKNLYGVIPGLLKPQTHYLYPDAEDFADMLVDINEHIKPALTLADAVLGMEGNGPTAGTPRHIGAVIASKTTYEADVVAAALIGADRQGVPTLRAAERRGLVCGDIDKIALCGNIEALKLTDFKFVPKRSIHFLSGSKFKVIPHVIEGCLTQKPKPVKKLCVGCGKCASLCPAKAITMRGEKKKTPHIDRSKCIKCFCCQEFCPKAAMIVHRTLIMKALEGKRLRAQK